MSFIAASTFNLKYHRKFQTQGLLSKVILNGGGYYLKEEVEIV